MHAEMTCDGIPTIMYCKTTTGYGSDTSSTYNNNELLLRREESKSVGFITGENCDETNIRKLSKFNIQICIVNRNEFAKELISID